MPATLTRAWGGIRRLGGKSGFAPFRRQPSKGNKIPSNPSGASPKSKPTTKGKGLRKKSVTKKYPNKPYSDPGKRFRKGGDLHQQAPKRKLPKPKKTPKPKPSKAKGFGQSVKRGYKKGLREGLVRRPRPKTAAKLAKPFQRAAKRVPKAAKKVPGLPFSTAQYLDP
ncbi:MAG: hypothetical protein F6K45_26720, partial [Kamptonema sp. SIO1D9]|nr:hypothetical protein [Kamptonema sp. SIO1D9]